MKKLGFLMIAIMIALSLSLHSCNKDEDVEVTKDPEEPEVVVKDKKSWSDVVNNLDELNKKSQESVKLVEEKFSK